MIKSLLIICFCVFLPWGGIYAKERPVLQDLGKEELLDKTIINMNLSALPQFRLKVSGQRIDIFLKDVDVATSLKYLPQSGSVLRTVLARKDNELLVSFLLIRPPKEAKVMAAEAGNDLEVHIGWDSNTRGVRPAIAPRLRGTLKAEGNGAKVRVVAHSKYSPQWERFFSNYRAPVIWKMPLHYTIPEQPWLGWGGFSDELLRARRLFLKKSWSEVASLLGGVAYDELPRAEQQAYLMLAGAAQIQDGNYTLARDHYQQFKKRFAGSSYSSWFRILIACGRARNGDPYGAIGEIGGFAKTVGGDPRTKLFLAEAMLATERPDQALKYLGAISDGKDQELSQHILLRSADAKAAKGQYSDAMSLYRKWQGKGRQESLGAYSLALMGATLEQRGEFREAKKSFVHLAGIMPEKDEEKAMALFGVALVHFKQGEKMQTREACQAIRQEYPGTEGACRARLMVLDLDEMGGQTIIAKGGVGGYVEIASTAPLFVLREEAAFKNALAVVLAGRIREGLGLLQNFRRDFREGDLRNEAEILTLEKLGPLVGGLLRDGESLDALVMIEKNRDLLATSTLQPGFAAIVAGSFQDLGLLERSAYVYRHLLDNAEGTEAEEKYYLPLVKVLNEDERYKEVLFLVNRYRKRFSEGAHLASLGLLQGEALLALGRLDETVALLPKIQLSSPEVLIFRDRVIFALAVREGTDSTTLAGMLEAKTPGEKSGTQLLRAERLWQEGQWSEALTIFQKLILVENYADQARYRSGQICLENGARKRGINFLRDLVEKGEDPFWQNLAQEMLSLAGVI